MPWDRLIWIETFCRLLAFLHLDYLYLTPGSENFLLSFLQIRLMPLYLFLLFLYFYDLNICCFYAIP
jgi:hypothetical protein